MICFILVALFVLFFVWGGAFIEGRHSFENTYFKGALIRGGRSVQNIYFKGALIRGGALFRGNTVYKNSYFLMKLQPCIIRKLFLNFINSEPHILIPFIV